MAFRLDQNLLRVKSKGENFGLLVFIHGIFFISYFDAPWSNGLTHPMLIIAFGLSLLAAKVTGKDWVATPI